MAMPKQKPGQSKQDYATPVQFIDATRNLLSLPGGFKHDFAADRTNAKASSYWTVKTNSLAQRGTDWAMACFGGWGWLNSPYDHIEPWAAKCAEARSHGASIAALWPASVGANWFRDHVWGQAFVLALNGRLAFMPDKPNWSYPKDCMLCLYSPDWEPGFDVWSWQL